ncbi:LLM class F420-dependent oxidoreductase [Cryobacterium melibiosiphilum]|uniref:LLM class F420-dependent oxidoreductase n=1 Tax=Cryobacterium melibiosiphilum TaxID=995039 RepID=A0A3A5MH11_9MICO|nr:LLM class F420-dependent oxidoreductase [Cryobacterium melibiosiphilum]RJT84681.1 LLM class F420-dependent oxidoreductase [Cryobacterium melibiosiphilum]
MTSTTNRPVRLGVQIAPQHAPYEKIRDTLTEVEALGADIAFNWDHFFPLSGDPDGLHFESWTMLAAWAEQTTTIQLGALVNCNSYRNADLQADMARTIDHISAGRFIFGTGAGWFERDYDEYGYEFGTPGTRLNALDESLTRIEARWGTINPPPVHEIPVLIGGGGEKKTLRIVAQHADIWHSFGDPQVLAHKLGVLGEWCTKVGRDITEIEISTELKNRTVEQADQLYDLGARLFTLGVSGPDYDLAPATDWLAWRDSKNA